jgi:hypothetical protein
MAKPVLKKRILHVVTNVGHYSDVSHRTGLWRRWRMSSYAKKKPPESGSSIQT